VAANGKPDPATARNETTVERKSARELVVTRTFDAPAHIVFKAWTTPALLQRWWAPKSYGISFVACEADVRSGGTYRFVFSHPSSPEPMEFVGRYIAVTPNARLDLDQRRSWPGRGRHHRDLRGARGQDPGRDARSLPVGRSARRRHRLRQHRRLRGVIRATRRDSGGRR
jgi:uncharacterized protein YndB with AHSA1/START domain